MFGGGLYTPPPSSGGGGGGFSGTPDRVMITDGLGDAAVSSITPAELNALSGISSNIQDQIDAVAAFTGTPDRVMITASDGTLIVSAITTTDLEGFPTRLTALEGKIPGYSGNSRKLLMLSDDESALQFTSDVPVLFTGVAVGDGTKLSASTVIYISDNYVGIGTDSPSRNLSIKSGGGEGVYFSTMYTQEIMAFGSEPGVRPWVFYDYNLDDYTMVQGPTGNWGIGLTDPQEKLHVHNGYARVDELAGAAFLKADSDGKIIAGSYTPYNSSGLPTDVISILSGRGLTFGTTGRYNLVSYGGGLSAGEIGGFWNYSGSTVRFSYNTTDLDSQNLTSNWGNLIVGSSISFTKGTETLVLTISDVQSGYFDATIVSVSDNIANWTSGEVHAIFGGISLPLDTKLVHLSASFLQSDASGLLKKGPDVPGTDGTYTLKATVSSGTVTYEWVLDV